MEFLDIKTDEIVSKSLQRLNEYTNLTFLSPGSKARLMVEILGEELGLEAEEFDDKVGSALIRAASGQLLDYVGEIYGLPRLHEIKSEVFAEEENFMLYTLEPNFGTINNGLNITIPAGSMNITNTNTTGPSQVTYTNVEQITLPVNENSFFFAAEARSAGEDSNVGQNTLAIHDFNNYADSLNRTLLVTNNQSITYGRDEETDENYRFRIQREKISAEAGNETSIRLAALVVPGVANLVRIPYERGIGTSDWLIKSTSTVASTELINSVQIAIDTKQSSGNSNLASSPVIIGAEMVFSLTYKTSLEDNEKEKIKSEVRKNVANYVNNLEIGESLVVDQIVKFVLNSSDQIESMGATGSSENFSNLFIHKRAPLTNSINRQSLVTDYKTKQRERVILEPRVETPIVIRDNN